MFGRKCGVRHGGALRARLPTTQGSSRNCRRLTILSEAAGVRWRTSDSDPIRRDLDAVIILAGGQRTDGRLHPWVQRRMEVGLDLQRCQEDAATPILCCGGGTPHKPPVLRPDGYVMHEGTELATWLVSQGVDARNILKEASSYDTIGNGYFAAAIHAVPAGWRRLGIVSSDFHMPRSRAIFETCFTLAGASLYGDPRRFVLSFHAASDEGVFPLEVSDTRSRPSHNLELRGSMQVLAARREREAASLAAWQRTAAALPDMAALHAWLHAQHMCYAVARQEDFGVASGEDEVDAKAMNSY